MIILGPKTAILGPQFCRILVLGPHFWWSGGAQAPGAPWIHPWKYLLHFFGLPLMPPYYGYHSFFGNPHKFEQGTMTALIGVQWKHGGQILPNSKLLNIILAQLMDCNATIDHNTLIPVHKLGQNYI